MVVSGSIPTRNGRAHTGVRLSCRARNIPGISGRRVKATDLVLKWVAGEALLATFRKSMDDIGDVFQEGNALAVCSRLGLAKDRAGCEPCRVAR